jgi:hypothetical protein
MLSFSIMGYLIHFFLMEAKQLDQKANPKIYNSLVICQMPFPACQNKNYIFPNVHFR